MSRRYGIRIARANWVYSRDDVRKLYAVSERTVTNWINSGLRPIDQTRPQLFAACELQRFISIWNLGKRTFDRSGRVLCRECITLRFLNPSAVTWSRDEIGRSRLTAVCDGCSRSITHWYSSENAEILKQRMAVRENGTGNTPKQDSDCSDAGMLRGIAGSGLPVGPESCSANLRMLHGAITDWFERDQVSSKTIDERLRALARLSRFHNNKAFGAYTKGEAIGFREALSDAVHPDGKGRYSKSTIVHTLDHCRTFFTWLAKQRDCAALEIADYFAPTKAIRRAAATEGVKEATPWCHILQLFRALPTSSTVERRNRAIVALIALTGMRADAVASMPRMAIDWPDRSVDQGVAGMRTKNSKRIRTFIIDIDDGMIEAIGTWIDEFDRFGFSNTAPLLPSNTALRDVSTSSRRAAPKPLACGSQISQIMRDTCVRAGFASGQITPHDLRRSLLPHLMESGLTPEQLCAVSQNLGHGDPSTTFKHYVNLPERQRKEVLRTIGQPCETTEIGVLAVAAVLRLVEEDDPRHSHCEAALASLKKEAERMFITCSN